MAAWDDEGVVDLEPWGQPVPPVRADDVHGEPGERDAPQRHAVLVLDDEQTRGLATHRTGR
jgi:hypothetical protein